MLILAARIEESGLVRTRTPTHISVRIICRCCINMFGREAQRRRNGHRLWWKLQSLWTISRLYIC